MKHINIVTLFLLLVACTQTATPEPQVAVITRLLTATPQVVIVTTTPEPANTTTLVPTPTATSTPTPTPMPTMTPTPTPVPSPMPIPTGVPVVSVTVRPENPGLTIAPDFVGLSFEAPVLTQGLFDNTNSSLIRLLGNLGTGTMRFGAGALEFTYWSPTTRTTFPKSKATIIREDLDRLFALAKDINWRVILGLNLGQYDPEMFADEASYAVTKGGSSLLALQIGNEPDLFASQGHRPSQWNYDNFRAEFNAYTRAIRAYTPNAPIAGPTTCCETNWFTRFLVDEGPNLVFATHHNYRMCNDPKYPPDSPWFPSIENLLSKSLIQRIVDSINLYVRPAQARNIPLQISETNSVCLGGKSGVSDVFASALWGADYMFTLAELGVRGVNLHSYRLRCGGGYNPICERGKSFYAEPLYYGILLFSRAGKGRIVPVGINSPVNVTAHATLGDDGKLRVTLINKDAKQIVATQIATSQPYTKASAMRLLGPSPDARSGITFGGRAVKEDGSWSPGAAEPLIRSGDMFLIAVPAASAVVVTFE